MSRFGTVLVAIVSGLALGAAPAIAVGEAGGERGWYPVRVSGPTPFTPGCDGQEPEGTLYPNAEVQPHLAVNPADPRHLVGVWQQDRWSGVGARGLVTATSFDGGARWTRATPAVSICAGGEYWRATDSQVSIAPDGTAYVVSLSMNTAVAEGDHAILVSRSRDGGRRWEPPVTLVREGTDPSRFVFNDLPGVTADPTDSRYVYVAWDRIVFPPLGGPLMLARSTDGGDTWQPARVIADPGQDSVVSGTKIAVRPDGSLVAFYAAARYDPDSQVRIELSYQAVRSRDKGRTWSAPTRIADVQLAGTTEPVSGRTVRDGSAFAGQLAAAPDGSLHAVWQDSRFSAGVRDGIALSSSTDGGRTWTPPTRVNPSADAQAFSPAIAITRDGTIGVSYSTLSGGSTATNWLARSTDRGRTWIAQRLTARFDLATAPVVASPPDSLYLGDYHGMAAAGRRFVTLFPMTTDNPTNRIDIFVSVVGR